MPTAKGKPAFAAQVLRQVARQIPIELRKAEAGNAKTARDIAVKLSSGTITTQKLRRMGHPYAVRDPQTPLRPDIINKQTGVFRDSWKAGQPETHFGALVTRVQNVASYSGFMRGTRTLIPRPIVEEIEQELQPVRKERIQQAIKAALTPRK